MSFCAKCGSQVTAGASFCTRCGAAVEPASGGVTTGSYRPSAETIANEEQRLMTLVRQATIGEYEIIAEIGRGGMAVVYLAHDLALDRKVAIKVMTPALTLMDRGVQERFKREARTAAQLSHPNIIPVFAVKETEHLVYFVMKYVIGRSLESVLQDVGALPIPVAQTILGQIGAALRYAHRQNVVHRDMKPGNVMLDEDGWVVVTDFGIAKVAQAEALTATGGMVGTPAYMSPEQCAGGEITGLADQYSVGVMAYEMLAGRQPFTSTTLVKLIHDHCHTPPPPLLSARPDCPPEVADAVMRMLAKSPAERWPSIEDAVAAIGAGMEDQQDEALTQLQTFVQAGTAERLLEKFRTPGSPVPQTREASRRVEGGKASSRPEGRAPRMRRLVAGIGVAALVAGGAWIGFGPGLERIRGGDQAPPAAATPLVARLDVAPLSVTLTPGERVSFRAVARDSSGQAIADAPIRWTSAAPAIMTVSSEGEVLALAAGTAELTARSGPSSAAAVVTVRQPGVQAPAAPPIVTRVQVQPAVAAMVVGDTLRLAPVVRDQRGAPLAGRSARWSTTDTAIVGVSADGVVTALGAGTARIRLDVEGRAGVASVTVAPTPVASLDVDPAQATVTVGGTRGLRATPRDRTGGALPDRAVTWQSSDPATATVSADGVVRGVTAGEVTIAATSGGVRATAAIVVEPARTDVTPAPIDARPEIERVIERYRQAIESRDLERLRAAYPGLTSAQERAWRDFFGGVTELSAALRIEDLSVDGDRATARIAATYEFRSGRSQTQNLELVATLERAPTGWRLVAIE